MNNEKQSSKDELQVLEHLYERRSHELKSIELLVKQKVLETQKYIDFCGDDLSYENLKNVLTEKLNESENKMSEARKRVKDIRLQKNQLTDKKIEADQITKSTVDSSHEIKQITTLINQHKSELEIKSKAVNNKKEEFKLQQNELEKYKSEAATTQKFLDNSKRKLDELNREKANLKQQQNNLSKGTEANRHLIKDIKSSLNQSVLQTLEKENEHLQILLNQATSNLPINIEETISQEELDPIYKDQITTAKSKLSNIKQTFSEVQKKFEESRKSHKIEMNDLRLKLDNLKKKNNMIRSSIESIESSIPQTLSPLTKELEFWRNKVENSTKNAKENEEKINFQRNQAELCVSEAEKQTLFLKDELKKITDEIKRLKITNDQKNIEMENIHSNLNELMKSKQSLSIDISAEKSKIDSLNSELNSLNEDIQKSTNELNESEVKYSKELNELKEEMKNKKLQNRNRNVGNQSVLSEIKISDDIQNKNEIQNEHEIRESVTSLENQFKEKKKQLDEINIKYEKTLELQKKFEAALDLIADLQDEEKFLTEELKMIREQFSATLKSLKNK